MRGRGWTFPDRRRRRLAVILAGLGIAAVVGAVAATACWWRVHTKYAERIHDASRVPSRDVALVPGAWVRPDGTPGTYLSQRLEAAAGLYRQGRVSRILVSGDNGREDYNEPVAMRRYLMKKGIPSAAIAMDFAGFRTLDTCRRAHRLWKVERAIVVTQRFHLPRALYLANEFGLDAVGAACDLRPEGDPCPASQRAREALASVLAWFDVNLLGREPRFWGERASWPCQACSASPAGHQRPLPDG